MAKYRAIDIANLFIKLANGVGDTIDDLKLNKLLFYTQGWSLARSGKTLFDDEIEAWDYGPVAPDVYHTFKGYKSNPITEPTFDFDESSLTADELELVLDVYSYYGKYTSRTLVNMTHEKDTPWRKVYVPGQNVPIPEPLMKEHFKDCKDIHSFNINFSPELIVEGITEDE